MPVYCLDYLLAADAGDESKMHRTYIHAESAKEALIKLAERFPSEPDQIHVQSIVGDHGQFVVGLRRLRLHLTRSLVQSGSRWESYGRATHHEKTGFVDVLKGMADAELGDCC